MLCVRFLPIWIAVVASVVLCAPPASAQTVTPINWNRFTAPALDPTQTDIKYFINKSAGYNLNWVEQTYPSLATSQTPSGRRYDLQTGSETEIRSLSHIIYSTAAMLKTGAFDAGLSGFDATTFRNRTIEMIDGAALEHISNNSGVKWGNSWQSGLWAAHLAEGAWLMWDDLPAATRTRVTNMVTTEANRFVNYNVPYWANPNGTFNSPGDTKAEENAWNSRLLSVAVAMMPTNANSQAWRSKASELMVSSFARPSDLSNQSVLDGKTVANWVHGYNAYENGFVENHGFIHDDYMATTGLTIEPFITQSLAGQAVPQAAGFNGNVVYNAMATVPVGSQQKTMFQRGQQGSYVPDVYYPQGTDWSLYRYDIFFEMDAYADLLGYDSGKSYDAMGWGQTRLDRILEMQARFSDGHLYAAGEFDTWATREPYALQTLTNVWMINWLDAQDAISPQGNWNASLTPPNVGHLTLRVDRTTGEVIAINTSNVTNVTLDGYAINSLAGQLNPAAWATLDQQGMGDWIAANPSTHLLSELRTTGSITISPGQQLSLGQVFAPAPPAAFGAKSPDDLQFQYSATGSQTFDGIVQYTGVARNSTLTLVVDPATGRTLLRNDTPFAPAIEGYLITSASGALLPANGFWSSLHDQGAGGGSWIEANPTASQVAELNAGSFSLAASSVFDLGKLFNTTHAHELAFLFLLAGQSSPMLGTVVFEPIGIPGDYNHDGSVDAADYVVWRNSQGQSVSPGETADGNYDGQVNQLDYQIWRSHFGEATASTALTLAATLPEPASFTCVVCGTCLLLSFRGGRTQRRDRQMATIRRRGPRM